MDKFVTYVPDADMPQATEQYGFRFVAGEPVRVPGEREFELRKFSGNRVFRVEDAEPVEAPAEPPVTPEQFGAVGDEDDDGDDDGDAPQAPVKRGRGRPPGSKNKR